MSLDRHWPDFFFHLNRVDHCNGVPGAAVEEATVGAFAQAFLAADAEDRVDLNAAERRIVLVGHPEHAVFHRAIFHAGWRARASGAALGNDRQLLRLLFARGGEAFRLRFKLELVGNHPNGLSGAGCRRHGGDYNLNRAGMNLTYRETQTSDSEAVRPKLILRVLVCGIHNDLHRPRSVIVNPCKGAPIWLARV